MALCYNTVAPVAYTDDITLLMCWFDILLSIKLPQKGVESGRVRLGQEVFHISRVGPGHLKRSGPREAIRPVKSPGHVQIICHKISVFVPLNAGFGVSVRRTRLNVLVLLTLASAGESPTCVLHEDILFPPPTPPPAITRAIDVSHVASLQRHELRSKSFLVNLTLQKCIFSQLCTGRNEYNLMSKYDTMTATTKRNGVILKDAIDRKLRVWPI